MASLYLVEEHHEAYLAWNHAIATGVLPARCDGLLHVDEHSDLGVPLVRSPVRAVVRTLAGCAELTYRDLGIASFIVPAVYQGLFRRVVWLRQRFATTPQPATLHVHALPDGVRLTMTGDLARAGAFNLDRRQFVHEPRTEADPRPLGAVDVLDIDLDYFSCDPNAGLGVTLEVTAREYAAFLADPYHPLRCRCGPQAQASSDGARHWLHLPEPWIPAAPSLKVDEVELRRRVDAFAAWLTVRAVQPRVITVCRSRRSGYTPSDQWALIEALLLDALHERLGAAPRPLAELIDPLPYLRAESSELTQQQEHTP
jgi:hypothetical protein